jgi:hypothetical protein
MRFTFFIFLELKNLAIRFQYEYINWDAGTKACVTRGIEMASVIEFVKQESEETMEEHNIDTFVQTTQKKTIDFEALVAQEMERRRAEIVLGAFREAWDSWDTLDELAEMLSDPTIRPYLSKISRRDFEDLRTMVPEVRRRRPNREKPHAEELYSIADTIIAELKSAPEGGYSKDRLLSSLGDRRAVGEEWWPDVKKIMNDRIETIGHGRATSFKLREE